MDTEWLFGAVLAADPAIPPSETPGSSHKKTAPTLRPGPLGLRLSFYAMIGRMGVPLTSLYAYGIRRPSTM